MKQGKLFVIEGASGSGKDTLLGRLSTNKSIVSIRGVASQNPVENIKLTSRSQKVYANRPINLELMLYSPALTRQDVLDRYITIAGIQLNEAVHHKQSGKTVIMNRSIISALIHLEIAIEKEPLTDEEKWLGKIKTQADAICESFIKEVNGIILMEEPIKGIEKKGIAGLQHLESEKINSKTSVVHEKNNVPLLKLNANRMSVEEETKLVKEFYFDPLKIF